MDNLVQFLQDYAPFLVQYRYLILGLFVFLDGVQAALLGGLLVSVGALAFFPAFGILVLFDIASGYLWYTIGYRGGAPVIARISGKKKGPQGLMEKARFYFNKHSAAIVLLAKITFSVTNAVMALAGSMKYNLREFSKYNFIGSVIWTFIVFFVGYFFGVSFRAFGYIREISFLFIFLAFLGLGIVLIRYLSRVAIGHVIWFADWLRTINLRLQGVLEDAFSDQNGPEKRP